MMSILKSVGKFWVVFEAGEALCGNKFRGTTARTAIIVQKEHHIQGSSLRVREEHLHGFAGSVWK